MVGPSVPRVDVFVVATTAMTLTILRSSVAAAIEVVTVVASPTVASVQAVTPSTSIIATKLDYFDQTLKGDRFCQ